MASTLPASTKKKVVMLFEKESDDASHTTGNTINRNDLVNKRITMTGLKTKDL